MICRKLPRCAIRGRVDRWSVVRVCLERVATSRTGIDVEVDGDVVPNFDVNGDLDVDTIVDLAP